MALTKTPIELSSTPSIVDGGNATAITIDSSENVTLSGTLSSGNLLSSGKFRLASSRSTYVDASEDATAHSHMFVTNDGVGDFSQEAGHLVIQARTHTSVYRDIIFAGGINDASSLMTIRGEGGVIIGDNVGTGYALTADIGTQYGAIIQTTESTPSANPAFWVRLDDDGSVEELFRVQNNGLVRAKNGIHFGSDTAAANALDDYEEGTFTPAIAGVSGTFSGDYTKIGDLVTFCIICTGMSGTASASLVTGLPFTAANNNRNYAVAFGNTNLLNTAGQSGQQYFTGFVVPNSTTVQIDTGKVGVANNRSNLAVGNSNIILEFSGSYKV
jgi:hypothetical protein